MDPSTSNERSFQNVSKRLSSLIEKIAHADRMDDETAEAYAEELNEYYNSGHYNLYSATYQWMSRDAADDSDMEYLSINFDQIIAAYKRKYPKNRRNLERVTKLADYILLEQARAGVQSTLDRNVVSNLSNAKAALNKLESLREEIDISRKESSAQTITVLSIFTGIAMAFFGGFSLLGSAFDSLEYGVPAVAIVSLIVGLILFNTIFVFLYVASKISGNPISGCGKQDCVSCDSGSTCKAKKCWITRIFKRYQLICVINGMFLLILLIFSILFFRTGGIKSTSKNEAASTGIMQSTVNETDDDPSSIASSIVESVPESQEERPGDSLKQEQGVMK